MIDSPEVFAFFSGERGTEFKQFYKRLDRNNNLPKSERVLTKNDRLIKRALIISKKLKGELQRLGQLGLETLSKAEVITLF